MAEITAARAPASNAPNAAAFSTAQAGARQTAQDAAQAAAMESEGGGSALSRFLGGEAGSATLKGAGKIAAGAGGLANAVERGASECTDPSDHERSERGSEGGCECGDR